MSTLRDNLKRLDSFVNRITGLGTAGDKGAAAEIADAKPLDDNRLEALHRSNAYAGVVVDELVEQATRKGWTVQAEDVPEGRDPKDITGDWDDDWDVRGEVAWAATLARLFGGALLFVVVDDGKDPREPFDADRPYTLMNLVVLDTREVFAHEWGTDITDRATFGRPTLWRIQPQVNGAVKGLKGGRVVHASRMVYFPGVRVSRRVRLHQRGFDDSVLRRALAAIANKTSIDQSRANIIQDFKTDILKTKNLDVVGTADEQLDYFEDRLEVIARSKSNVNMVLLDEGEEFQKNSTSVAGLADLDGAATEELTTAARMPRTRFTGEAPGGLNTDGESQNTNWNSQVASYQSNVLKRRLVQLYRFILGAQNGPTEGVVPDKWSVEFGALEEPTEQQKANLRKTVADTDALYLDRGVLDPMVVADGRFGEDGWKLDLPFEDLEDLDVPADPEDPAPVGNPTGEDVQKSALNGAQVASMLAIVQGANEGLITEDQAAQIVARAFQIPVSDAADLVARADAIRPVRADSWRAVVRRVDAVAEYDAPEAARNNARKALRWRDEHPEETAGAGTAVGWARARQLASGSKLSRETVGRMANFARHKANAKVDPKFQDEPWKDHGYLMWLAWGGDTGVTWAGETVAGDE